MKIFISLALLSSFSLYATDLAKNDKGAKKTQTLKTEDLEDFNKEDIDQTKPIKQRTPTSENLPYPDDELSANSPENYHPGVAIDVE